MINGPQRQHVFERLSGNVFVEWARNADETRPDFVGTKDLGGPARFRAPSGVVFRSAKERSFAERKTTRSGSCFVGVPCPPISEEDGGQCPPYNRKTRLSG